jgi:DNA-binding response OmpR family regulator
VAAYVTKPFDPIRLLDLIRELLARTRSLEATPQEP